MRRTMTKTLMAEIKDGMKKLKVSRLEREAKERSIEDIPDDGHGVKNDWNAQVRASESA